MTVLTFGRFLAAPALEGRAGVSGLAWPARYEIRVDGVLDVRWADWFGGLRVENNGSQTVIVGVLADQPAVHGVLARSATSGSACSRCAESTA